MMETTPTNTPMTAECAAALTADVDDLVQRIHELKSRIVCETCREKRARPFLPAIEEVQLPFCKSCSKYFVYKTFQWHGIDIWYRGHGYKGTKVTVTKDTKGTATKGAKVTATKGASQDVPLFDLLDDVDV